MIPTPVEYFRVSFTVGLYHCLYAAGSRAAKKAARAKTSGGTIRAVEVLRFNDWVTLYRAK